MNEYIVAIYHFFNGYQNFNVLAENKEKALMLAKEQARRFGSGNYDLDKAKVVKKVKKKRKV